MRKRALVFVAALAAATIAQPAAADGGVWADTVIDYSPGAGIVVGPDGTTLGEDSGENGSDALGAPDCNPTTNLCFTTLGFDETTSVGGSLTVGFSGPACLASGGVKVYEVPVDESYDVYVGWNEATHFAGSGTGTATVNTGATGLQVFNQVKIVATDTGLNANANLLGAEIDAVECLSASDTYLIVDSSIDAALDEYAPDTAKPDYSVSGVIGLDGNGDEFGMIELRYHDPKITCYVDVSTGTWRTGDTGFDADSIQDYAGVDNADYACDNGDSGTFASLFFLDPVATDVAPDWPGGAVVVDEDGDRTTVGDYDLIGGLASSYYWVPLDRGDVFFHVW